jgi:hypothetical protein
VYRQKAMSPHQPDSDSGQRVVDLSGLPRRCFISHAYQDKGGLKSLLATLPDHVEPVIFPRRDPDPESAVSNGIVVTILDCPGLIYIDSGISQKSFWVSFERDYALRADRAVFAYDPQIQQFRRDTSPPLTLEIQVVSHWKDDEKVERLISWMADERHFVIEGQRLRTRSGGFSGDVMVLMEELLRRGGVVLWMIGRGSEAVARGFYSEAFLDYLKESSVYDDVVDIPDHADLIDDHADYMDDQVDYIDEYIDPRSRLYDQVHDVFVRIDPMWEYADFNEGLTFGPKVSEFLPRHYHNLIDLYQGGSDSSYFNWNRVDDLIIQLYARILKSTSESRPRP